MKKQYQMPTMKVARIQRRSQLLSGSPVANESVGASGVQFSRRFGAWDGDGEEE